LIYIHTHTFSNRQKGGIIEKGEREFILTMVFVGLRVLNLLEFLGPHHDRNVVISNSGAGPGSLDSPSLIIPWRLIHIDR